MRGWLDSRCGVSRYGLLVDLEELDSAAREAVADLVVEQSHVMALRATRQDAAEIIGRVERLWNDRAPLAYRTAVGPYVSCIAFTTGENCDEEADRRVVPLQAVVTQANDKLIAQFPGLASLAAPDEGFA